MTNRRAFLAAILGAPAALALDPERLLWRPGAKLISVPAPRVVALNRGDLYTIPGIYAVNPQTGKPTGIPLVFTAGCETPRERPGFTAAYIEILLRDGRIQVSKLPPGSWPPLQTHLEA